MYYLPQVQILEKGGTAPFQYIHVTQWQDVISMYDNKAM